MNVEHGIIILLVGIIIIAVITMLTRNGGLGAVITGIGKLFSGAIRTVIGE